jgi:PAS domain S-box-containing protein
MAIPTDEPGHFDRMRRDAELRIRNGTANAARGGALGSDALSLLYGLASNPATADDALKLLHEMQVHQVELDLQHREMTTQEQQMGEALAHYRALFEFAPVAYLVLTLKGDIMEANAEAANLLDMNRCDMAGCRITNLVSADNQLALSGLMKRLNNGEARTHCHLRISNGEGAVLALQLSASVSPGGTAVLAVLSDQGNK